MTRSIGSIVSIATVGVTVCALTLGAAFPGDNASFSQDVMPLLGGSTTSASSSVQVTNYSIVVFMALILLTAIIFGLDYVFGKAVIFLFK